MILLKPLTLLIIIALCPLNILKADYFRIIEEPTAALQCRIDLIRHAQKEILVSSYIVKDDNAGKCVLSMLVDAAQRGVLVRLLMDANAGRISARNLLWLQQKGVQIRKFRTRGDIRRLWHRLHDKMLLVDFNTLIVGGRNLKNEYFGVGKKFNFKDCDALIYSDSAGSTARQHFYSIWNEPHLSRNPRFWSSSLSAEKAEAIRYSFDLNRQQLGIRLGLRFDSAQNRLTETLPSANTVYFIHDDFFRLKDERYFNTVQKDLGSTIASIALFKKAHTSVVMENPYLSPTRRWRKAFKKVLDQGAAIRILTNSKTSTDIRLHYYRYRLQRNKLLRMGVELWEYQGPEKLHTKAMVIDDAIVSIGSYNLHYQSQRYNTEIAGWVRDPVIAYSFRVAMDEHLKMAVQVPPLKIKK